MGYPIKIYRRPDKMAIVSAEKFVQAARDNGYAVGGFNTNNLEWTQAILRAAEAKKAPVLIQTSMGAAKYLGGYNGYYCTSCYSP